MTLHFRFAFLAIASLTFALSAQAAGESRSKCEPKKFAGHEVQWCHYWQEGASPRRVYYYFHGIGGDQKSWEHTPLRQALELASIKARQPMPHVFTISFGPAWFLTDVKRGMQPSRLSAFLAAMVPASDAALKAKPQSRVLIGESMGGFNALRAGMENAKLFTKVAALCPAVLPVGPYATPEEEQAFIDRNPQMDADMLRNLKGWAQSEFPSPEAWVSNSSLERAKNESQSAIAPLFLTGNLEDQYGFHEGTAALAAKLGKKVVAFRSQAGAHCQNTEEVLSEVAEFLLKP